MKKEIRQHAKQRLESLLEIESEVYNIQGSVKVRRMKKNEESNHCAKCDKDNVLNTVFFKGYKIRTDHLPDGKDLASHYKYDYADFDYCRKCGAVYDKPIQLAWGSFVKVEVVNN
jgi:hypothetical protein